MFSAVKKFKPSTVSLTHVRYKRTDSGTSLEAQRVINQLSVMSAGRKMPKMLKLCNEDYVKHQTIMKAWSLRRKEKIRQETEVLRQQYDSMKEACEDLKSVSPKLFEFANQHEYGKRFPLEMHIPTDYPPRQVWFYDCLPQRKK